MTKHLTIEQKYILLNKYVQMVFDVDVSEEFEEELLACLPLECNDLSEVKDELLTDFIQGIADLHTQEVNKLYKD